MARRRRTDDENVWPLTEHASGYIVNRGGVATVCYGNQKKSTGMPFARGSKGRAVRFGNQWVSELKDSRSRRSLTFTLERATLYTGWAEFTTAKLAESPPKTIREYKQTFKAWVAEDLAIDDETIHRHTIHRLRDLKNTYAPNTLVRRVDQWSHFLAYCRDRGWLSRNPFDLITKPKRVKKEKVIVYSEEEIARIVRWFEKRIEAEWSLPDPRTHHAQQYVNLWPFLARTAFRISEALSLFWEDAVTDRARQNYVTDNTIILQRTKTGPGGSFPLDVFPEVKAILKKQRPFAERNRGHVFLWSKTQDVSEAFMECITALNDEARARKRPDLVIETGNRPVHVFRATCEERWRREGLPDSLVKDLARHSGQTYESAYRTRPLADELAEKVRRARESWR